MYQIEYHIETVGEVLSCPCTDVSAKVLQACARASSHTEKIILESNSSSGSEDATYLMEALQKNGRETTYCILGTKLAVGHYNEEFEIQESTLLPAAINVGTSIEGKSL